MALSVVTLTSHVVRAAAAIHSGIGKPPRCDPEDAFPTCRCWLIGMRRWKPWTFQT